MQRLSREFAQVWNHPRGTEIFSCSEEADLGEHSGTNQIIFQKALEDGYGNERAGWSLEYCARASVQMMALFLKAFIAATERELLLASRPE